MAKQPKVTLSPLNQVGIVVKDIDKAVKFYTETFGLGPFQHIEYEINGFIYEGKTGNCRVKSAMFMSGQVNMELIQILEGETPHTKFLRENGEGLHHVAFQVDDLDGTLTELANDGIHPVFHGRFQYQELRIAFAYINSDKVGGVIFEFFELK